MSENIKPGVLCWIVNSPKYAGRIAEVLYAAPTGQEFVLPNGRPSCIFSEPGYWVIKVLGGPVPTVAPNIIYTNVGVCHQYNLKPIPPLTEDEQTETRNDLEVPA